MLTAARVCPDYVKILESDPTFQKTYAARSLQHPKDYFLHQSQLVSINGIDFSGKTSVVNALSQRGHPVAHEQADAYFAEQKQFGFKIPDLFRDIDTARKTQTHIIYRMFAAEQSLSFDPLTFIDQGLGGAMMYASQLNMNLADLIPLNFFSRYHRVFLLDPLPYNDNPHSMEAMIGTSESNIEINRQNNHAFAELLYRRMGYDPIRVPVMSINERVEFILDQV